MRKRTWAKLIASLLLVGAIAVGLCIRWSPIVQGSDPSAGWGRGDPTLSERTYHSSRINRIAETWAQTRRYANLEEHARFGESYRTILVIDLDRKAVWIENGGQIRENNYAELPSQMKWRLHRITPEANKELFGRVALKMRGFNSSQHAPEIFQLVGRGRGQGHYDFQFHASGGRGVYNPGRFRPAAYRSRSSKKVENPYGSLLVTDSEYEQLRADGESPETPADNVIEKNKANWLRVEKSLYAQIEKHLGQAGFKPYRLKVAPGPNFSAGHAEIRGRNDSVMSQFFGGRTYVETYLKIDYLGNDIWYAKSARHPQRGSIARRNLDLEFIVCPTAEIADSRRQDLLAEGRKMQQSVRTASSAQQVTLANGTTIEFIGVCESPSAGRQWWGPDGSLLDYVPYINAEPNRRTGQGTKIYDLAWSIRHPSGSYGYRQSWEGTRGSHSRQVRDRYGYRPMQELSGGGRGFEESRRKTTWRLGVAGGQWQTALTIVDEAAETKFLDRQRIILNPPQIENGQIVVRCLEDSAARLEDYGTDFALIYQRDSKTRVDSLEQYPEAVNSDRTTGMTEHVFTLRDVQMSQIEGVCFRYRPYERVEFRNISLVPGKNFGFEIHVKPKTETEQDADH
ncbi:MAG: hypothetical protein ACYSWO_18080 [Planctomycetota bacterium]|jgi:hypothetical protein